MMTVHGNHFKLINYQKQSFVLKILVKKMNVVKFVTNGHFIVCLSYAVLYIIHT